jgi:hypothetical protein
MLNSIPKVLNHKMCVNFANEARFFIDYQHISVVGRLYIMIDDLCLKVKLSRVSRYWEKLTLLNMMAHDMSVSTQCALSYFEDIRLLQMSPSNRLHDY